MSTWTTSSKVMAANSIFTSWLRNHEVSLMSPYRSLLEHNYYTRKFGRDGISDIQGPLLDAGADPEVQEDMSFKVVELSLLMGSTVCASFFPEAHALILLKEDLRQLFARSSYSIDLGNTPYGGSIVNFLFKGSLYVGLCTVGEIAEKIAILLNYGLCPATRDAGGRTCLFYFVDWTHETWSACRKPIRMEDSHEALRLLINAGADINAIDDYGWSVSAWAERRNIRDHWEDAMAECGIEPCRTVFRKPVKWCESCSDLVDSKAELWPGDFVSCLHNWEDCAKRPRSNGRQRHQRFHPLED